LKENKTQNPRSKVYFFHIKTSDLLNEFTPDDNRLNLLDISDKIILYSDFSVTNKTFKIKNKIKFDKIVQQILEKIDKLDNKFINPKFEILDKNECRIIKIDILYKDLKSLFNFNKMI
jgi:hypothetical protein